MASYATGTATGAGALNNFFVTLAAHLVTNGWTQHDVISSVAGSRDVIFRGAALDATADVRPFVRLTQTSTTVIAIQAYSDWDTATHAGLNVVGGAIASCTFTGQDASFTYYFWFDGYGGVMAGKIGASINRAYFGFSRRGIELADSGLTKTTGSLAIGATALPVASDMTGKMRVGQKIQIQNYAHASGNANASNSEVVSVTSIGASSIGCSALTKAYDSAAIVGENCYPMIVSGSTTSSIGVNFVASWNGDGTRTAANGQTIAVNSGVFASEANVDPGDVSARYGSGFIAFSCSVAGKTEFKGYPRGAIFCAGGAQVIDDIMQTGSYSWLVMDSAAAGCTCIGPREL